MSMLGDFKNEMRQKLLSMNSEFSDSDMLIDFVIVMMENKKPKEYVFSQLLDLTNETEAKEITEWLFNWLSVNPSTQPNSSRVFQVALHQANLDAFISNTDGLEENTSNFQDKLGTKSKKDLRNRIKKTSDLRNLLTRGSTDVDNDDNTMDIDQRRPGPQRKERRMDRKSPYGAVNRDRKEKVKEAIPLVKCSFFPNCNRADCLFFHPTEPCLDGKLCTKGKLCLYIHEPSVVTCKFAENCTNPNCAFSHPSPASIALAKANKMSQIACKYFPGCLNTQCPFLHDPALVVSPPIATNSSVIQDPQQTICRFDPNCTRYGCYYIHPSRADNQQLEMLHLPSVHKTWVNSNSISDHQFISNEKVEKVEMHVDS